MRTALTRALPQLAPGTVRTPSPKLGEHTMQVMREFMGMSDERIGELAGKGVLVG